MPPTGTRVEKHAAALLCTRGVVAKRDGVAATKRADARVRRAATAKDIFVERERRRRWRAVVGVRGWTVGGWVKGRGSYGGEVLTCFSAQSSSLSRERETKASASAVRSDKFGIT